MMPVRYSFNGLLVLVTCLTGVSRVADSQVVPPSITYVDGQLTIDARDISLADIMVRVAALTKVTIDMPEGLARDRLAIVKFGPAPARQVLAWLLQDAPVDYVLQASDEDPTKLASVTLLPKLKANNAATDVDLARLPSHPLDPRTEGAIPEKEEVRANPSGPEEDQPNAVAGATPNNQSAAAPLSASSHSQPNPVRPGALSPPEMLNSANINQQLQQMYQQRVQLNRQGQQQP